MKNKNVLMRSSFSMPAIVAGLFLISGIYAYEKGHNRQYSSGIPKGEEEKVSDALGMQQYFFNARKNITTNSMDYKSMAIAEAAIQKANKNKRATAGPLGLNWNSLGPSNIGGRTRAILVDNQDKTGNTLFAGGVSGGLWKSTNGGGTWDSINENLSNMNVACIAQDVNGNIYIGTGEGFSLYYGGEAFSTAILGGGIFESTDGGVTFNQLSSTNPSSPNNMGAYWAYTNRIAIQSNNPSVIYAGTSAGLFVSMNGGSTWTQATNSAGGGKLGGSCLDVKISTDASIVVACINGIGYYTYPTSSGSSVFTRIPSTGSGKLPGGFRIEFAIAPSDHDRIYCSIVNTGGALVGMYMTKTAVSSGNGGYWYCTAPGGSVGFNPYSVGGGDQGTYDNTMGVPYNNSNEVFAGGTTLYRWNQAYAGDTLGTWTSITTYYGYVGDPTYIHPDEHAIVFDPNNPGVVYVGCDGGIYKSVNAGADWVAINRDYDVTQYYAIACASFVNTSNSEGAGGGTQDNGTPYVNGNAYYPKDAVDVSGGDGGQSVISFINPNAYYVSSDFDALLRSANLSGLGSPGNAYDHYTDSIQQQQSGCFVDPLALWENPYDTNTVDSIMYYGSGTYKVGDTIYPNSPNGQIGFPYILKSVPVKDTFKVQNRVQSRIATAFSASNGVWINMHAVDFDDAISWIMIGGPQSKPTSFTGADPVHCIAWSPDGDALFVGTEGGQLFRFSNLNHVSDTANGAVLLFRHGAGAVTNPHCVVVSTRMTSAFAGRDILSISVSPTNGNQLVVTLGNYGTANYVYYCGNALGATPTFNLAQGNLPEMPVYGSVMGIVNSSYPNGAVIATEHGIYSTTDVTAGSPVWGADNSGMANVIVCAIKQQTAPQWLCNNSGDFYIGTHGRGLWYDKTFFVAPDAIPQITNNVTPKLKIYPNPMNTVGNIQYTLTTNEKVSLEVYDLQGKLVKTMEVPQGIGAHIVSINVTDMPAGTYIATLTGGTIHTSSRFIVVK